MNVKFSVKSEKLSFPPPHYNFTIVQCVDILLACQCLIVPSCITAMQCWSTVDVFRGRMCSWYLPQEECIGKHYHLISSLLQRCKWISYQEIHPYSAMNIDSVKLNTSLVIHRRRSQNFPRPSRCSLVGGDVQPKTSQLSAVYGVNGIVKRIQSGWGLF